MLKKSIPINPLNTQPDEPQTDLNETHVSLRRIDRQSLTRSKTPSGILKLPHSMEDEFGENKYDGKAQFWDNFLQNPNSQFPTKKIAIIGKSGTGKTLLLQKIAYLLLEHTEDVPIWITPSQLTTSSLKDYVFNTWLDLASRNNSSKDWSIQAWQECFQELLNSGRVWFLLDGMNYLCLSKTENSSLSPLSVLVKQLQNWSNKSHIILTCQTQTWKTDPQVLSNFETYQTQELSDPNKVQEFIKQWFDPQETVLENQSSNEDLEQNLYQFFEKITNKTIRKALSNPLRLALFCRLWQQNQETLPQTTSQLYQQLVPQFYQWQAEGININLKQQQQLNKALETLALTAYQTSDNQPILSQETIEDVLGEDASLLSLAIQLKWLNRIGVVGNDQKKHYYTFFDATFNDYFAALAIDDWRFFCNHDPEELSSIASKPYPIFDSHWWGVILCWLGRGDLLIAQKEAFMEALVTFNDGCGQENFYGLRAYFLAAMALSEFPDCSFAEQICRQLIRWELPELEAKTPSQKTNLKSPLQNNACQTLNHLDHPLAAEILLELLQKTDNSQVKKQGFRHLETFGKGNSQMITALSQCLATTPSATLRWQVAETLGKIDPGNTQAIGTFVELLNNSSDESRKIAFSALKQIGQQNIAAITALVGLLHNQSSSSLRREILQCLESIGGENPMVIGILTQYIRITKDLGIRRQIAASLEKVDPGNPTAIIVLVKLTQEKTPEAIRREAVYSLGEITPGNEQGIDALVTLMENTHNIYMCWTAVSSLGKIGTGNKTAIAALEKLIESGETLLLRKEALESLGKIEPTNPTIIRASVSLMEKTQDEAIHREAAETLGNLDPGNPQAIKALTKLLKLSKDNFTRRQAAASLGKIDPGNLEALTTLMQLIQGTEDPDIASLAADSLGEIAINNPAAIATLIRLLQTSDHLETQRCAIKSLGKIAIASESAVTVFTKLLLDSPEESLRIQIAESLIGIVSVNQMKTLVTQLRDCLLKEANPPYSPSYRVLWHCAQHLSYQEFYQAWHQESSSNKNGDETPQKLFKNQITPPSETLTLIDELQQAIAQKSDLGRIYLVGLDSSRFIDPDNPPIDIYDQMLEQDCPSFDHGIPETMAKLRLYWNILQRDNQKTRFVLLLYVEPNASTTLSLSSSFLEMLSKFQGLIAVVTDQDIPSQLTQFSPNDTQLIEKILDWITYSY